MKIIINGYSVIEHFNIKFQENIFKKLNRRIEILKQDKEQYLLAVVLLALLMTLNPSLCFAEGFDFSTGQEILNKAQIYIGIAGSIMCTIELATELIKGGRGYFQILYKYGTGYAAVLLAPTIFEMIRNLF